ncbi:MAG: hypothetical protein CMP31_00620 [Roseibacillus sp.]|jgi:hypothetical protein|nr:hypothetical protein [Roseibacillus sp.]MDP7495475.1 hypothetical protein [Roseibacillus sp.]|tara:strand:+ start:41520 stop:41987 length:468 start_codon:yes stop_codon:yes gene_type:complete
MHDHPYLTTMKGFVLSLTLASFVSASLPAALPGAATTTTSVVPRPVTTKAVISGLEDRVFETLPPVLIELSNLPAGAVVWVEVKRGVPTDSRLAGKTVESKFYLRKDGVGVLSVPGIHKACRAEGTWTVSVLMSDAHGTTTLSRATFVLQSKRFA